MQSNASTSMARNPMIWADVPDIAIIRVGDVYYMSSTTAHMNPGVPIMKSTDLVNWKMVNYAYQTLGDSDELDLKNGKNAYSGGSWASSLRYHNGTFYLSTFSGTTGKTYVYETKDIEQGPWTKHEFEPKLHDHTLFFDDDGRVYMIYGGGEIRIVELNSDMSGLKPGGVNQTIIPNASLVAGDKIGLPAEGSQMMKVDGKYYLFNIVWPPGGMRTELVHRADRITGPYEGRIALQDQGIAQGSIIDTPKGNWVTYMFQDHGAVGRVPVLVPMKWENGWPVLGMNGKVPETFDTGMPAKNGDISGIVASDEFNRKPGELALPLQWQWNHNPDNSRWSLSARPGFLRLTTGRLETNLESSRNMLTQRTFGPQSAASTMIDVSAMKDGDVAGLSSFQKKYGYVGVKMEGGAKSIVMVSAASDTPQQIAGVGLNQNKVWLKVDCDFNNKTDKAYFYYSLDGKSWTKIGEPLQMVYTLPQFIGYRFALFNYATKEAGGTVDFDYFRVSDQISATG